jgi:MoaA/NifB/PqqE/SkfB family radical SAM enzyme
MTRDHKNYIGDLNTQSVEEVWNGEPLRNIRKAMINGEEPFACSGCYDSERVSRFSHRVFSNADFKDKLEEIPTITATDGTVKDIDLKYWDFRFSNICNFKCRTCGPEYSSSWIPDAEKISGKKWDGKILNIEHIDNFSKFEFLKKHIDSVEKIYFAGGEPLLMEEHWQILDLLDSLGKYDVVLNYNTNLSKTSHGGKNVFEYWKKWGTKVSIWPSIDEIDDRAELVRSGTNWKTIENNLRELVGIGVDIRPNITVSAMNVFRLPEILDRLIHLGVINNKNVNWPNFSLNIVNDPYEYCIDSIPVEIRQEIRKKIIVWVTNFSEQNKVDCGYLFSNLSHYMKKPFNPAGLARLKHRTSVLDAVRDENSLTVIPELREIFSYK